MKKYFVFIIILLLFGGICAYAGYNYQAKDITYIKPDGIETNIQSAMTELFNKEVSIIRGADIPSGTTIDVNPGTYIFISSVDGVKEVTNAEVVYPNARGGLYNYVTSDTSVWKATGSQVKITIGIGTNFTYYLVK